MRHQLELDPPLQEGKYPQESLEKMINFFDYKIIQGIKEY